MNAFYLGGRIDGNDIRFRAVDNNDTLLEVITIDRNSKKETRVVLARTQIVNLVKVLQEWANDSYIKESRQLEQLIMAVHQKFPDETRFDTALRYIQEAEKNKIQGPSEECVHLPPTEYIK